MAFQATFCIITGALVAGAVVERMRFGAFLVFAALWSVLVYAVLAHWAFGDGATADGSTVEHVYGAGAFTARLTSTSATGETAAKTFRIAAYGLTLGGRAVVTYRDVSEVKEAEEALRYALALDPQLQAAYYNRGLVLTAEKRPEEAKILFRRARQIAPEDARVHEQTARALALEKNWAQAETELRWLVAHDPQAANYHFLLGRALRSQGKVAEADAEFETSRRLLGTHSTPEQK